MTESQASASAPVGRQTVEAVIRGQLSKALGGRRGIVESAIPMIVFTLTWMYVKDRKPVPQVGIGALQLSTPLQLALGAAIGVAVLLLVVRLVQRSTVQFTVNGLIGIGIAAVFASRTGRAEDAFLPGIIYNSFYAAVLMVSIFARWPFVGLMIGAVTGDLTKWREDPAIVRLCSLLTWMFVIPCLIRVAVQFPIYLAGDVPWLATAKLVMGWPLQVAGFGAMVWLLSRNRTPLAEDSAIGGASPQAR